MAELKSASHYYRNNLLMTLCFFLVFTAFSTLQNLMGAVLAGGCLECSPDYHVGNKNPGTFDHPLAIDVNGRDSKKMQCAWTDEKNNVKICGDTVGQCKNSCPYINPSLPKAPKETALSELYVSYQNDTAQGPVEMKSCPAAPVGNTAVAILYAFFTICCIGGPLVVEIIGAKWCMVIGFSMNTFFCVANVLVVKEMTNIVEEAVLYPASALVGVCASFLWTAQGTYLTRNANFYADAQGLPRDQALGTFNGVFFAGFQCTQLSGNLLASVLTQMGLTTVQLFLLYTAFAAAGSVLSLTLADVPATIENNPCTQDLLDEEGGAFEDKAKDDDDEKEEGMNPMESVRKMVGMWSDPRMVSVIPLIMYTGLEVSFIWSDFTTNYIAGSLGVQNIGYCMAIFGAADVVGSIGLGKLSDVVGRPFILIFGAICQASVLGALFVMPLEDCNQHWTVIIPCAIVWGFGDAAWNTQICSILGETFVEDKESAFANFKFWQSLTCAAAFGYIPAVTNKKVKLIILCGGLACGMAGAFNLFRLKGLEITEGESSYIHDKDQADTPVTTRGPKKVARKDKGFKEPLLVDEED